MLNEQNPELTTCAILQSINTGSKVLRGHFAFHGTVTLTRRYASAAASIDTLRAIVGAIDDTFADYITCFVCSIFYRDIPFSPLISVGNVPGNKRYHFTLT